ncbi:MAG: sigma-54 dependent transcriptional regulator [Oceanipulchritudo sp.]
MTKTRVLLVEDDASLRAFLEEELEESGFAVLEAGTLAEARRALLENGPDLVLSDLKLPDGRGDALLLSARELPVPPPVILVTAFGQVDEAVDALRRGAADFLTKPLDMDHLLLRLERTIEVQNLRKAVAANAGKAEKQETPEKLAPLGKSPVWRQIEKQLPQIARTDDPVLITGPSGVGKEVVARRIHMLSERRDKPFIPVNCSGLPDNLLDSELFGHQPGAFTGAEKARKGLFLTADGGTLLLDEIGDMPMEMQTKLLRTLQEAKIRPLGADEEKPVNVRILASTNRVLEKQIQEGAFREDLYYRLETFHLKLPALADRSEDIEWLAGQFISDAAGDLGKSVEGISENALKLLKAYPFPGNVRELVNIIRRSVAFSTGRLIGVNSLPEKLRQSAHPDREGFHLDGSLVPMETLRQGYARHVLAVCDGNKREAARILKVSRQTLYNLIGE